MLREGLLPQNIVCHLSSGRPNTLYPNEECGDLWRCWQSDEQQTHALEHKLDSLAT